VYEDVPKNSIFLSFSKMQSRIEEMAKLGVKSLIFSGEGEPLLNPEIDKFFECSRSNKIDMALITNGISLTDKLMKSITKNVTWVRFSVNGGDSLNYSKIHNVTESTFQRVINNIIKLIDYRNRVSSDLVIGSQIILLEENYRTVGELAIILREIGVDYLTVKPYLPLYNKRIDFDQYKRHNAKYLEHVEQYSFLNDASFSFKIRLHSFDKLANRHYLRCLGNPFYCEVKSNGDLMVCGVHISSDKFKYGNLYESSFRKIWDGSLRKKIKRYLEEELDIRKTCMPNCRLDEVNRFLYDLKNPPEHLNFI